jgi:hypothetical protein
MTAPAEFEPLAFDRLDPKITVWGVASLFDEGVYMVSAEKSAQDAVVTAGLVASYEPPGTVTLDEQLVYHHPDRGWVFAGTGENCRTL